MSLVLRRIERMDQHRVSQVAGRLADSRALGPLLKILFRMRYLPRTKEVERPSGGFVSLNDLFARRLRKGARPVEGAPLVGAADGRFGAAGTVTRGQLLQAKGRTYTVAALLAGDAELARQLDGGSYVTVYLSPRDYHRFHAPCSGRLVRVTVVPGRLMPVNRGAVRSVDQLFATNERTFFVIDTGWGPVVVVAVAAFLVSGVVVTAAPAAAPPDRREVYSHVFHTPATIVRGQELGYFRFGSTVVVLAPPGFPGLLELAPGAVARVGLALSGPGEVPPLPELARPASPAEAIGSIPRPSTAAPDATVAPSATAGIAEQVEAEPDQPLLPLEGASEPVVIVPPPSPVALPAADVPVPAVSLAAVPGTARAAPVPLRAPETPPPRKPAPRDAAGGPSPSPSDHEGPHRRRRRRRRKHRGGRERDEPRDGKAG